jgi:hypothetical protein
MTERMGIEGRGNLLEIESQVGERENRRMGKPAKKGKAV